DHRSGIGNSKRRTAAGWNGHRADGWYTKAPRARARECRRQHQRISRVVGDRQVLRRRRARVRRKTERRWADGKRVRGMCAACQNQKKCGEEQTKSFPINHKRLRLKWYISLRREGGLIMSSLVCRKSAKVCYS